MPRDAWHNGWEEEMSDKNKISVSHWGLFPIPDAKTEKSNAQRDRIEKILFPIMECIVDIRA